MPAEGAVEARPQRRMELDLLDRKKEVVAHNKKGKSQKKVWLAGRSVEEMQSAYSDPGVESPLRR